MSRVDSTTSISPPRISVIVCTCDRPDMLRRAVKSVLGQELDEPFELIVVDAGQRCPAELPPGAGISSRIIRLPGAVVGAARAAGLAAARGQFIAWCDDDDEWTGDHLSILRDHLVAGQVDLVYGDAKWVDDASGEQSVPYSVPHDASLLKDSPYIFATDAMHRAAAARDAGGFDPQLGAYEDWDLWLRMSLRGPMRHVARVLSIHHWHEGSISATDAWQTREQVREAHHARLQSLGLTAQHDLAIRGVWRCDFDRSTWQSPVRKLIFHGILRANQGYGSVARQLLIALESAGVDVTIAPTLNQPVPGFERFYKPLPDWNQIGLYYNYLDRPSVLPLQRIIHYAMAESTFVPEEKASDINRAVSLLCVPCRQNVETFRACGVRVPIRVLPHGVDPQRWPVLDRTDRPRGSFTFGTFGELSARKGIDVLVRAFHDEFHPDEPVQLLMKTSGPSGDWAACDERIRVVEGFIDHPRLLELLRQMDAFVMPSRGEGFGLCGLEAMASGLPLIATNWSGPADYLDEQDSFPLSYHLVDAGGIEAHGMNFFGQWAQPDYAHLRQLMRWIFEHQDEAARRGARAAQRVRRDWTWKNVATRLIADLDELSPVWSNKMEPTDSPPREVMQ